MIAALEEEQRWDNSKESVRSFKNQFEGKMDTYQLRDVFNIPSKWPNDRKNPSKIDMVDLFSMNRLSKGQVQEILNFI